MELLVSKRIWGFPLMDRKCNTEELSSTRIKTIVFQFIFVFKFCLSERLLTFMVSSYPATLLPWVSKVFFLPYGSPGRRSAKCRVKTYKQMPLGLQWCATALCALWFWYFYALETVSFGIISNTDGYVFISGKSQTAFPGKKIKCNSRVHDFMFDNFGLGGVLRWPRRVTHAN